MTKTNTDYCKFHSFLGTDEDVNNCKDCQGLITAENNMKKKKYVSVLHNKCGGEVVLVGDKKEMKLACKKCNMLFGFEHYGLEATMFLVDEFKLYKNKIKE